MKQNFNTPYYGATVEAALDIINDATTLPLTGAKQLKAIAESEVKALSGIHSCNAFNSAVGVFTPRIYKINTARSAAAEERLSGPLVDQAISLQEIAHAARYLTERRPAVEQRRLDGWK